LNIKLILGIVKSDYKSIDFGLSERIVELLIRGFYFAIFVFPFPIVFYDLDVLHIIFKILNINTDHIILFTIFRFAVYFVLIMEIIISMLAFISIGLMVVCSANDLLKNLLYFEKRHKFYRLWYNSKVINFYKRLQLWMQYTNNNFCSFAVPPLLYFGVTVLIISNYGAIRFKNNFDSLSMFIIYLLFPVTSGGAFIFVFLLIPQAVNVHDYSIKCLAAMEKM
jgi:hypothetical protein